VARYDKTQDANPGRKIIPLQAQKPSHILIHPSSHQLYPPIKDTITIILNEEEKFRATIFPAQIFPTHQTQILKKEKKNDERKE